MVGPERTRTRKQSRAFASFVAAGATVGPAGTAGTHSCAGSSSCTSRRSPTFRGCGTSKGDAFSGYCTAEHVNEAPVVACARARSCENPKWGPFVMTEQVDSCRPESRVTGAALSSFVTVTGVGGTSFFPCRRHPSWTRSQTSRARGLPTGTVVPSGSVVFAGTQRPPSSPTQR